MNLSHEVEQMVCVAKGPKHGPAPIPQEGQWTKAKEIKDILISMGYDLNTAFGIAEGCPDTVMFEDYCKFSSSIQIFFS